ncbi:palmitoyltransferase pfa4 [Pyrenophora seminiperda CCB06]|uniref:Palmitoyltransferase pfa4 n=1 Tax=Pyrenophora seminiperda CCB06 TaxID=1302712 RepID=A0A3M7LXF3_9PLEO|nr:palmitoyltransferase pfa4 [Pyrenophora seminiperda CCB06]
MPSYLGPTPFQLAHLFAILIINSITLFVLGVLLLRNIWCLAVNTTTIEGWEIERHRTLVRRARQFGGYLAAPDGVKVRIKKQEFPYDIGIWANIVAGMDSANPLNWFNPFASTPRLEKGLRFETNDFEDENKVWPPPDPDRNYRKNAVPVNKDTFRYVESELSREDEIKAFKARQAQDEVRRRKTYVERVDDVMEDEDDGEGMQDEGEYGYGSEEVEEEEASKNRFGDSERESVAAWRNSEGERLKDFGVDEDVEFYDEQNDDDVPLSELLARKRAASMSAHSHT